MIDLMDLAVRAARLPSSDYPKTPRSRTPSTPIKHFNPFVRFRDVNLLLVSVCMAMKLPYNLRMYRNLSLRDKVKLKREARCLSQQRNILELYTLSRK